MKNFLILFCLIFILSGCTGTTEEDFPYVKIQKAELTSYEDFKSYQGFIYGSKNTDLSFGASGIMNGVYVSEGEYVKKGKLLAKLDNDEYNLNIQRATAELADAKVKYNRAKSYYERISKLYKAGGISYNDWEASQTDLKSSTNSIKILEDALNIEKKKETFSNIYAPFDGLIVKSYKDEMEYVSAGEAVFFFQGNGELEARVFVSQNDINSIKQGDTAALKVDAFNKTYNGAVKSKVSSSANEGSFRVKISIFGVHPELLDGMSVTAKIGKISPEKEMLFPVNAVLSDYSGKFVYILIKEGENFGKIIKRPVETGALRSGKIQITNGINRGEFVVVAGTEKIMENSKVKFYD